MQEVREQDAHLVVRERVGARPVQLVPLRVGGRLAPRGRDELVPRVGGHAAAGADAPGEYVQQHQRPGDQPAVEVAGGRRAPDVRRERRPGACRLACHLHDRRGRNAALALGELRRVLRVLGPERGDEVLEGRLVARRAVGQVGAPVDPAAHELAVEQVLVEHHPGHRQQHGRLRPGPRRQPVVRARRCVRQARIDHRDLGAALLRLDDPLRMRVEVVPRLQVGRDQQHEAGVRVIRGRPVGARPQPVAGAAARRADVGVRVVAVAAPRLQEPVREPVLPRTPDEIADVVVAPAGERFVHPLGERVQHVIPAHPLPLAAAARPRAAQGVQDPLGIGDLVERGRALGAVATTGTGMAGMTFELANLERVGVDVGEQPARRLAVEADGRHEHRLAHHLARPRRRVVLHHPAVGVGFGQIAGDGVGVAVPRRSARAAPFDSVAHQLKGTLWPARTQASS